MADARGHYNTRQQAAVLSLMHDRSGESLTIDEIHDTLEAQGASVGRTTIYRLLGRLAAEQRVLQIADPSTGLSRYCFADGDGLCLACLECHRVFPIDCEGLETFEQHVSTDHNFKLEPRHTVLYGYCGNCTATA